jgi:hypothetical protein
MVRLTHKAVMIALAAPSGDDAAASKACSDHRPIWIRVRVPATDDD